MTIDITTEFSSHKCQKIYGAICLGLQKKVLYLICNICCCCVNIKFIPKHEIINNYHPQFHTSAGNAFNNTARLTKLVT